MNDFLKNWPWILHTLVYDIMVTKNVWWLLVYVDLNVNLENHKKYLNIVYKKKFCELDATITFR